MITWSRDEALQQIITRDIPSSDAGSIATFNDFPDWMIEEARIVAQESRRGARDYIRFYLAQDVYTVNIAEFVQEVVVDGAPAATWRVYDMLCIPAEPQPSSLLTTDYLQVLEQVSGERWYRLVGGLDDHPASSLIGAVGVIQHGVRFKPKDETNIVGITQVIIQLSDLEQVPAEQLERSVRRWWAHRMAWRAQSYIAKAGAMVAAQGILDAVAKGEQLEVTRDAEIAAAALAREVREHAAEPDFLKRAGYLGPDSWYEG